MIEDMFRDPTDTEIRILEKLTQLGFPGREDLPSQIHNTKVRTVDEFGSIKFEAGHGRRVDAPDGPILNGTQSHAESVENYGPFINYVIFMRGGYVEELQIYKDDGGETLDLINPERIFDVFPANADPSRPSTPRQ